MNSDAYQSFAFFWGDELPSNKKTCMSTKDVSHILLGGCNIFFFTIFYWLFTYHPGKHPKTWLADQLSAAVKGERLTLGSPSSRLLAGHLWTPAGAAMTSCICHFMVVPCHVLCFLRPTWPRFRYSNKCLQLNWHKLDPNTNTIL